MTESIISDFLKRSFEKLFDLDKLAFERIAIDKDLIENICQLARQAHPKEFLAFLDGKILDKRLLLDKLLYYEYTSSEFAAHPVFRFNSTSFFGSVHSHPGPSSRPSNADRQFFRKMGIVHMVICYPYNLENLKIYNQDGEEIHVEIV